MVSRCVAYANNAETPKILQTGDFLQVAVRSWKLYSGNWIDFLSGGNYTYFLCMKHTCMQSNVIDIKYFSILSGDRQSQIRPDLQLTAYAVIISDSCLYCLQLHDHPVCYVHSTWLQAWCTCNVFFLSFKDVQMQHSETERNRIWH